VNNTTFDVAFSLVVKAEGSLSLDARDAGNWTGGRVNAGQLKGTKWGISAASYPALDIANLTLADAKALYNTDYYLKAGCDLAPPGLALCLFDTAVNNGPTAALRFFQTATGAQVTGKLDDGTKHALQALNGNLWLPIAQEIMARRVLADVTSGSWPTYGLGWVRRIIGQAMAAVTLGP
jgi:lysozyme family protein